MPSPAIIFRVLAFLLAGLGYAGVLRLLGGGLTGAGHGTDFFYVLSESPFGAGLVFWPLVAALVPLVKKRAVAGFVILALGLHYGGIGRWWFFEAEYPGDGLAATWQSLPLVVVIASLIYVTGQILIWWYIIRTMQINNQSSVKRA